MVKVTSYLQSWVGLSPSLVLMGSSPYPTNPCGAAFSSPVRTKTLTCIGATLTDLGTPHNVNSVAWWTGLVVDRGIISVNLSPACSDTMTHSKAMVIELAVLMTRLVSIACTTTSTVTLIGKLAHRAGTRLRTALGKCRVSRAFLHFTVYNEISIALNTMRLGGAPTLPHPPQDRGLCTLTVVPLCRLAPAGPLPHTQSLRSSVLS